MHVLSFSHPTRQRPESTWMQDLKTAMRGNCTVFWTQTNDENEHALATLMRGLALDAGHAPTLGSHEGASLYSFEEHEAFMSEIQLKGIVDKMAREASSQGTDGDEVMTKNGAVISKFSKDFLEIGAAVGAVILDKVGKVFDLNWGDDAIFRARNGAPKIMTKFKDKPYSYELLPEYANGSKKFATVKSMNWEGKSATAKVVRGFTESTPVVQRCPNPRSISRLVIVPKVSPGQVKDDPDHGFRVCASTLSSTSASNRMLAPYLWRWMRSRNWLNASTSYN